MLASCISLSQHLPICTRTCHHHHRRHYPIFYFISSSLIVLIELSIDRYQVIPYYVTPTYQHCPGIQYHILLSLSSLPFIPIFPTLLCYTFIVSDFCFLSLLCLIIFLLRFTSIPHYSTPLLLLSLLFLSFLDLQLFLTRCCFRSQCSSPPTISALCLFGIFICPGSIVLLFLFLLRYHNGFYFSLLQFFLSRSHHMYCITLLSSYFNIMHTLFLSYVSHLIGSTLLLLILVISSLNNAFSSPCFPFCFAVLLAVCVLCLSRDICSVPVTSSRILYFQV